VPELTNPKNWPLEEAVKRREALRSAGGKLVLTNGCFDLLHTGHLFYLREAGALGDALWIALNGDRSTALLKGPKRPVQSETERAYALAALEFVDGVVVFHTPRLVDEILALQPDIYVKAGDYDIETLHEEERRALESVGAEIRFIPFLQGYSTTRLIHAMREAADEDGRD
jgi:rfaE bifunctional protein nucleotidyltransferase chain/domain